MQYTKITSFFFCRKTTLKCDQQLATVISSWHTYLLHIHIGHIDAKSFYDGLIGGIVDCKTVRIFAYSSTLEQSNKRSETRLETESETEKKR